MPQLSISNKNLQTIIPQRCWQRLKRLGCPEFGYVTPSGVKFRYPYLYEALDWLYNFRCEFISVYIDRDSNSWAFSIYDIATDTLFLSGKGYANPFSTYIEAIIKLCSAASKARRE